MRVHRFAALVVLLASEAISEDRDAEAAGLASFEPVFVEAAEEMAERLNPGGSRWIRRTPAQGESGAWSHSIEAWRTADVTPCPLRLDRSRRRIQHGATGRINVTDPIDRNATCSGEKRESRVAASSP